MFDRFTDRARQVMGHSRQHAQKHKHDYIGTEHILLGLVSVSEGVGGTVLNNIDVDLEKVGVEVERRMQDGDAVVTMGQVPFTPPAKRVLELSLEEATGLGHTYIGTEHLLLGLIAEEDGIAARVLRDLAVDIQSVRNEILELLGSDPADESEEDREESEPVVSMRRSLEDMKWLVERLATKIEQMKSQLP